VWIREIPERWRAENVLVVVGERHCGMKTEREMRPAPSRKQWTFRVCDEGVVRDLNLETGALRGVGLSTACNDEATQNG